MKGIGLVLALALTLPVLAEGPRIGDGAPEFSLPSASDGSTVTLKDVLGKNKAVVVVFVATRCPYSNGYNERLEKMSKEYAEKGVAFIGINSNKTEPSAEVAEHAKKNNWMFPVLKDEGNKVADAYNARKTPEVYLIDARGTLVYQGRIDENHEEPSSVQSPDLKNALDAILTGKRVPKAETKAFGCTIKRV